VVETLARLAFFVYVFFMSPSRKNVDENVKRKPGRPATGMDPVLSGRVPKEVIARVDQWATENGFTRSIAVSKLLERGLDAAAKVKRKPKHKPE
jgi:hypothetical protein